MHGFKNTFFLQKTTYKTLLLLNLQKCKKLAGESAIMNKEISKKYTFL